jgi:hypothetical protein
MLPLKLWFVIPLVVAAPALAQGTMQPGATTQRQDTVVPSRTPVATQPSNDPLHNPISQGVPPAASANSSQNGNQTNVPR